MAKRKRKASKMPFKQPPPITRTAVENISLMDIMEDGREFASLVKNKRIQTSVNLDRDIKKSFAEITSIRQRAIVAYLSNVVNQNIRVSTAIDYGDDLPFNEMISSVPDEVKDIDILLVSPGGSAQQVSKFVDRLRSRFDSVHFILPNIAMSAATIFALSGDEIIMDSRAYIGPIDPQVMNKEGQYVPAQSILTLLDSIKSRGDKLIKQGQNPPWTDLQILRQIDGKEIGNAINASNYSIELAENYLSNYKFRSWENHANGARVTDDEKIAAAHAIAEKLCDHSQWKTHSRGITRELAWEACKIKIISAESIPGLERAIRRFWALIYWIFENTTIYKMFLAENYGIFRNARLVIAPNKKEAADGKK